MLSYSNRIVFTGGTGRFAKVFKSIESKTKYKTFSKSVKFLNKNKLVNNFFKKFADSGMTI